MSDTEARQIADYSPEGWAGFLDGYCVGHAQGYDRGYAARVEEEEAAAERAFAEAREVMRRAVSWPVVHPEILTAPADELRDMAIDRQQRVAERFRADHERRRRSAFGGAA